MAKKETPDLHVQISAADLDSNYRVVWAMVIRVSWPCGATYTFRATIPPNWDCVTWQSFLFEGTSLLWKNKHVSVEMYSGSKYFTICQSSQFVGEEAKSKYVLPRDLALGKIRAAYEKARKDGWMCQNPATRYAS